MGRIVQGANGGFRGKAGSVIGSAWRDVEYIKGRPKPSSKAPSLRQLEQQLKFSMAVRFLRPIKDLLNFSYDSLKKGRATGFNMALRQVLAHAVQGTYPDYEINYAAVQLASGPLAIAEGSATAEAGGVIRVEWAPDISMHNRFADDEVTVLIYDPHTNIYSNGLSGKFRADGEMEITMRSNLVGRSMQVYYFFTNRDGKLVSPSFYAGQVVLI
ncbi:MAG TPA: DUF6266 family protein [Sphingobacteriaceae bacterium]